MLDLTEHEKQSGLWQKIDAYLTTRLTMLHRQLEADLPESKTSTLRGRILEVRDWLHAGQDRPRVE
jgi:hypothetical protein